MINDHSGQGLLQFWYKPYKRTHVPRKGRAGQNPNSQGKVPHNPHGPGKETAEGEQRERFDDFNQSSCRLLADLEKKSERLSGFGKSRSKQLFQSNWDIATFAIFFIFIGAVLALILLVLIRCCWGCCFSSSPSKKHGKHKVGVDNLALEP
ncbi:hypothetical protein scyTo_0001960 [Scyliorhinus torazame]|uniref:Small integral membrane protein 22 n=1 Tax=Scyliorhinus torazame TaxID=75743 RepID=A0A401PGW1_SCYTO|nr:hypothetical protein [Scyliorhinus torazame]